MKNKPEFTGLTDNANKKVYVGDTIKFIMPSFCSGEYIYKVKKVNEGGFDKYVFDGAPSDILSGCRYFYKIDGRQTIDQLKKEIRDYVK